MDSFEAPIPGMLNPEGIPYENSMSSSSRAEPMVLRIIVPTRLHIDRA
jgi:hypothetical protein